MKQSQIKIQKLNRVLSNIAHAYKFGDIELTGLRTLEHEVMSIGVPIRIFDINQDGIPNVNGFDSKLVSEFKQELDLLICERNSLVESKSFEILAAQRDYIYSLREQHTKKIINNLGLHEGFNYYENQLVIVKPEDVNQKIVLTQLFKKIRIDDVNF